MNYAAIRVEDVSFSYGGAVVLDQVRLDVQKGDFACVVGPNGGGKSTLLKLLLGLLIPSTGVIRVLGEHPVAARRRVGYMPQHARLDPAFPATTMDVVLMGRLGQSRRIGPYRSMDHEIALRALREVELQDQRRAAFASLSGGQRQRALIARALACEPQLLLLDEPTAGLDIDAEAKLYELLRRLNERLTIVLVSHDVGYVSKHVRTAICVNRTVHVHASHELTGEVIRRLYGRELRQVRHSQEPGHVHGPDCHHEQIDGEPRK